MVVIRCGSSLGYCEVEVERLRVVFWVFAACVFDDEVDCREALSTWPVDG